ncbi:MAG: response regulator transcription factor [Chloroflexi bacterium]|nr:response regulator transcription factor [Chloroflexota bacterium]
MIKIALAEDHLIVRQGLLALLAMEPDFSVVGETSDGLEVVPLVERLQPDVLVLDLMLPGMNGLDITRQVVRRSPQTQVVILSMHADEVYVLEALRTGAKGYVLKGSGIEDLMNAVHEVAEGRVYLSPPLSERAIAAYIESADAGFSEEYESLTSRERQVFHLAAEGQSNRSIATRLSISPRTAETHRTNLMRKLALHTQAELIAYAIGRGIVAPEDSSLLD